MKAKENKVGLVFAILMGGAHALWSLFVFLGWGHAIINFVLWAHGVSVPLVVMPFNFTRALVLVILTSALGYILGYIVAIVWNKVEHMKHFK